MRSQRFSIRKRIDCRGFTLVEIVMVLGIGVIIAAVIVMSIAQLLSVHGTTTAHMTTVKEVENAVHYLTRDAQMAQRISTGPNSGFPLTLRWTEWNGNHSIVTYSIVNNHFERSFVENDRPPVETVIIAHVDPLGTSCSTAGDTLVFTITSGISAIRKQSETRSFTIVRRTSQ